MAAASHSSRPSAEDDRVLTRISADPISVPDLLSWATRPTAGGIGVFVGTTRDSFQGKRVTRLEYEAFLPMARKALNRIGWAVLKRYGLEAVAMQHRVGAVPVAEASVAIVCSGVHRREALEGAAAAIAAIKARLPVWKLEWYAGDSRAWKENCECAASPPTGRGTSDSARRLKLDGPEADEDAWLGPDGGGVSSVGRLAHSPTRTLHVTRQSAPDPKEEDTGQPSA